MLIPPDKKSDTPEERPMHDHHLQSPPTESPPSTTSYSQRYDTAGSSSQHAVDSVPDDERTYLLPPPYVEAPPAPHTAPRGGKPRRHGVHIRLIKAACIALALLIVAALLGIIPILVSGLRNHHGVSDDPDPDWQIGGSDGQGGWDDHWAGKTPLATGESSPHSCDLWSNFTSLPTPIKLLSPYRYSTDIRYVLPVGGRSSSIFFHGRGSQLRGDVKIMTDEIDDDPQPPYPEGVEDVVVTVRAVMSDKRLLHDWHICRTGAGGDAGVVLLGPTNNNGNTQHDLKFEVRIRYPSSLLAGSTSTSPTLPAGSSKKPYPPLVFIPPTIFSDSDSIDSLSALEVSTTSSPKNIPGYLDVHVQNMPISYHSSMAPASLVFVRLGTSNAGITVASLTSEAVGLVTSNGHIKASEIRSSDTVAFTTTNGAIQCDRCCAPKDKGRPLDYLLTTSNAPISGNFCAHNYVDARTSSGKISGTYEASKVSGTTSNGAVSGTFSGIGKGEEYGGLKIKTSTGKVDIYVLVDKDAEATMDIAGGSTTSVPTLNFPSPNTLQAPPDYFLEISTSNAGLNTYIRNLPANSTLFADLKTSNADLTFHNSPRYSGQYMFTTSNYAKIRLEDLPPLSGEPKRDHTLDVRSGMVSGWIKKATEQVGRAGAPWGSIVGTTTNGNVNVLI